MKKRIIAIILLLAMCTLIFGACAQKNDDKTTSAPETSTKATATETSTTATDKVKEVYSYKAVTDQQPNFDASPNYRIEKMLNDFGMDIDLSYIPGSDMQTKVNLMFAGGAAPDFFFSINNRAAVNTWGMQGYLHPFNEDFDRMPNYKAAWGNDWDLMIFFKKQAMIIYIFFLQGLL